MKPKNLVTLFGKKYAALNKKTLLQLRKAGLQLHKNAFLKVGKTSAELSIKDLTGKKDSLFASEIDIYIRNDETELSIEINFGTTGAFNLTEESSVWRTLHAAEIIKYWKKVEDIIIKAGYAYDQLERSIFS